MLTGKPAFILCMCVCVCFAGYMLRLLAEELLIQPLNYSVVFLKEKNVIFTNDVWRNVIDFDMGPYEEVIWAVKEDLLTALRHKNK